MIENTKQQQFIKMHDHSSKRNTYQLRGDDKIETSFKKFAQSNRTALARCVRTCWMEPDLIQRLPLGCLLAIDGLDSIAVKLTKGDLPSLDYLLQSNQDESHARILLHTNAISLEQC